MMNEKIRQFIEKTENIEIEPIAWLASVVSVVFLRNILEAFSSPRPDGKILSVSTFFFHYPLYYICVFLLFSVLIGFFAKKSFSSTIKFVAIGSPIILLPSLIDLIVSFGRGIQISYILGDWKVIWINFLTFGHFYKNLGASVGYRIEVLLGLLGIFWYIKKYAGLARAVAGVLVSYFLIFTLVSFPSIIVLIARILSGLSLDYTIIDIYNFYGSTFGISGSPFLFLGGFLEQFDYFLAKFYFILSFLLAGLWFFLAHKDKAIAVLKNSRPERILSFILIAAFGFFIIGPVVFSFLVFLNAAIFVISLFCAGLFSIAINDIEDLDIDRVSNPSRPLITGDLEVGTAKNIGIFSLIISLTGFWLLGPEVFTAVSVCTAAYYIYSSSPLRLKRVPVFSSFLISLAFLGSFLGGFFTAHPNLPITIIPRSVAFLLVLGTTLLANFRDLKDIEGDKVGGIKTLPILLGEKNSKLLFGALFFLIFIAVPATFTISKIFFVPAFLIGAYSFWAINRKNYEEKFVFVGIIGYILFLILFWSLP